MMDDSFPSISMTLKWIFFSPLTSLTQSAFCTNRLTTSFNYTLQLKRKLIRIYKFPRGNIGIVFCYNGMNWYVHENRRYKKLQIDRVNKYWFHLRHNKWKNPNVLRFIYRMEMIDVYGWVGVYKMDLRIKHQGAFFWLKMGEMRQKKTNTGKNSKYLTESILNCCCQHFKDKLKFHLETNCPPVDHVLHGLIEVN